MLKNNAILRGYLYRVQSIQLSKYRTQAGYKQKFAHEGSAPLRLW